MTGEEMKSGVNWDAISCSLLRKSNHGMTQTFLVYLGNGGGYQFTAEYHADGTRNTSSHDYFGWLKDEPDIWWLSKDGGKVMTLVQNYTKKFRPVEGEPTLLEHLFGIKH